MKSPKWLEKVIGCVGAACINDVKGRMSGLSYRWSKPEDNSWGTWLVMIAPSAIEIAGGKRLFSAGGTRLPSADRKITVWGLAAR
jgi:hypothetical protein